MMSQFAGGFFGGGLAKLCVHKDFTYPVPAEGYSWKGGVVAEMLWTGILVFIVLHVATSAKTKGNSYFGMAIGLTVAAGAYAVGEISGAAFNPAIGLCLPILGGDSAHLWIYVFGDFVGAVCGAFAFVITEDRLSKRQFGVYMEGELHADDCWMYTFSIIRIRRRRKCGTQVRQVYAR
jgi:aquaporin Z